MKFIEFTGLTKDYPIYINPSQVVSVRRSTDKVTLIMISAAGADGNLAYISVRESPEEAVAKLSAE